MQDVVCPDLAWLNIESTNDIFARLKKIWHVVDWLEYIHLAMKFRLTFIVYAEIQVYLSLLYTLIPKFEIHPSNFLIPYRSYIVLE